MSFYNVANPSNFNTISDNRYALTAQSKLIRVSGNSDINVTTQYQSNSDPVPPEIIVGGHIFITPNGGAKTLVLPTASDLATLLYDVKRDNVQNGDIFTFRIFNRSSTNNVTVARNTGSGESNTGSNITITASASPLTYRAINLQFTITTVSGVTTYSYKMF
jgi:hypothetical protein